MRCCVCRPVAQRHARADATRARCPAGPPIRKRRADSRAIFEARLGVRHHGRRPADPVQRNLPSARLGLRSSLRVPIRLDGRLVAALRPVVVHAGASTRRKTCSSRAESPIVSRWGCRASSAAARRKAGGRSRRARLAARVARAGADRRARRAHRIPPRGRRVAAVARGADAGDAGRAHRHDGAAARRIGNRQGSGRALPPPRIGAQRRAVRRHQLRGAAGTSARGGAVRLRARRLHRRDAKQAGAARAGRGRHAVPRRSRRDERRRRRRSSCACSRSASSSGSAARACCGPTPASSPPPTAICSRRSQRGTFREDLYYRLNVFAIRLPPLRDRRDDIAAARARRSSARSAAGSAGRRRASRATRAQLLMDYHWPGNVRELRNVLERAAILCDGGLISPEHLALSLPSPAPSRGVSGASDRSMSRGFPTSFRPPPCRRARRTTSDRWSER